MGTMSKSWECDWDREVKTNPELHQFVNTLEIVDPLQPQDAYFGRRTNVVKLHHVTEPDERL